MSVDCMYRPAARVALELPELVNREHRLHRAVQGSTWKQVGILIVPRNQKHPLLSVWWT